MYFSEANETYHAGEALFLQNKYEDAVRAYANAMSLCSLDDYYRALAASEKVIEIDPKNADAWFVKGTCLNDIDQLESDRVEETREAFDKAIEINPEYANAWVGKGISFVYRGDYDKAIQMYDEAIKIDPNSTMAWYWKGSAFDTKNIVVEAIKAYDRVIEISNNLNHSDCWVNRAQQQRRGIIEDPRRSGLGAYLLKGITTLP